MFLYFSSFCTFFDVTVRLKPRNISFKCNHNPELKPHLKYHCHSCRKQTWSVEPRGHAVPCKVLLRKWKMISPPVAQGKCFSICALLDHNFSMVYNIGAHWSWRCYFHAPTSPLRCPSRLRARSPTSLSQPLLSGVPQGSVLGPLLFIAYIAGLTNALSNSSMSLYADDLLLYRTIQSPSDNQTLQAEIDVLSNWISAHKLQLNCDKCKCMLVTRKRDSTMPTVLLISGQPLKRVYSYKYLGVLLTSDLSWSAHISTLCSKAWQQIGFLYHKCYRYSDVDTLKQLYVAFICPHLEYATAVWDPCLSKDIQ